MSWVFKYSVSKLSVGGWHRGDSHNIPIEIHNKPDFDEEPHNNTY
jgi:hypothetical protein